MTQEFETGIRDHLAIFPNKRVQMLLDVADEDMPKRRAARRRRRLNRMEAHARAQLGKPVGAIDWSKVDWSAIIQMILKLLSLFLAI